jgi:hypothetical protein
MQITVAKTVEPLKDRLEEERECSRSSRPAQVELFDPFGLVIPQQVASQQCLSPLH